MRSLRLLAFELVNAGKEKFDCPFCNYHGAFGRYGTMARENAKCPKCGSLERHRLQKLVIDELSRQHDFSTMSILHFAPEPFFRAYFTRLFNEYISADLYEKDVDRKADLCDLPFEDHRFDVVFASHVLEHIKDDLRAISEVRRVLKVGGFAILPIPVIAEETIEYPSALEEGHFRAPGLDYYAKYGRFFSRVITYSSSDFPSNFQTYIYEDRESWPTKDMPLRKPMAGPRHLDVVPVAYV